MRGDGHSFDLQHDYPNFFSLPALDDDNVLGMANFSSQSISIFGLDPDFGVMPRTSTYDSSIGFFHDDDSLGPMQAEEKAILFEIPDSPMLSIFQFRHANLNNYSHGPSYALGNSYASPQVARYKTWGKMKGFSMQPKYPGMNIFENIRIAEQLQKQALDIILLSGCRIVFQVMTILSVRNMSTMTTRMLPWIIAFILTMGCSMDILCQGLV